MLVEDMAADLLLPVTHDADGSNDEGAAKASREDQTNDLQSLAKTHIVGEYPAGEKAGRRLNDKIRSEIDVAASGIALPELNRIRRTRLCKLGSLMFYQPRKPLSTRLVLHPRGANGD